MTLSAGCSRDIRDFPTSHLAIAALKHQHARVTSAPIGRELELDILSRRLSSTPDGPIGLLIQGEPGIGKTTVWRAVLTAAADRGWAILSSRPIDSDAALAFTGLRDLFDDADDVLPELPAPQRHALEQGLLLAHIEDEDPVDRRAVAAGVTSALKLLAGRGPLVIAIDDAQWLDGPSTRILAHAAARIGDLPIAFVHALRGTEAQGWPLQLDRSIPAGRLERLILGPLSEFALGSIIKGHLDKEHSRRTLARIQQASGGNPFYALEVARLLPADDRPGPFLPLPQNLRILVADRISRLPVRSQQALLAIACSAAPTPALVLQVVDGRREQRQRALDRAEAAGVVSLSGDRLGFTHPLIGATVYSSVAPAERRRMHRRLAEVVGGIEEQARHLALGTVEPDDVVAERLVLAAESAARRGAPDAAADLMEAARRLTPQDDADALANRAIRAADYHYHNGELELAQRLLHTLLRDGAASGHEADALRVLGEIRLYQESFVEAIGLFEQALGHASDRPLAAAVLESNLAFATVVGGDFTRALAHAERALALAIRASASAVQGQAIAVACIARYLSGYGLDDASLDRAVALEDWSRPSVVQIRPTLIAGTLYLYDGQLERSRETLERLRREVIERGLESDLAWVSSHLAWLGVLTGDLAGGQRHAEEALQGARRHGSRSTYAFSLGYAALVLAHLGRVDEASAAGRDAFRLGEETGFRISAVWAAQALGVLASAAGDAHAVHQILAEPTSLLEREGLVEAIRAPFLGDEIEALVELGSLDRAEGLLEMLDHTSRGRLWVRINVARGRSLLYTARRRIDEARAVIRAVLDDPGIDGLPIEQGRCLLVLARVERRAKRRGAARVALLQAEAIFAGAGAELWLPRVRAELDRLGLAARQPGGLSASEERIARLAAGGATNREIAAQLLVSPKTVEASLARAYSKLAIRSRAQLGTALAGASTPREADRDE